MSGVELLLLSGKPGSGKSTMSKAMLDLEGAPSHGVHLSIGEHLRAIGNGNIDSEFTDSLVKATDDMAQDKSVPHDVTLGVIGEFIEKNDDKDLIILDGLRAPEGLDRFKQVIHKVGARVLAICESVVDDETVYSRIGTREQRYSTVTEDEEFIRARLQTYADCMVPTIEHMKRDYPYHAIDGTCTVEVNAAHLLNIYKIHTVN